MSAPTRSVPAGLSPRRRQVLTLLLDGQSEKEISAALNLSPHTVHVHVKRIYLLFGVTSRPELMAKWIRHCVPPKKVARIAMALLAKAEEAVA